MIVVGLTGSIGMGKSTTAALFREEGIPVHDSDATVHRIYAEQARCHLAAEFPQAFANGFFDRAALAAHVLGDATALKRLEMIIHPLVSANRSAFLREEEKAGSTLCVLDVPLLFETGLDASVDVRLVVTAPPGVQEQRVLQRPGMTPEKLQSILERQLSDEEKRKRAHWIFDTSHGIDWTRRDVRAFLRSLGAGSEGS
jgi:dephospho-CoA kinase